MMDSNEVERALQPIRDSLSQQYKLIEKINDKMDALPAGYVTRNEYVSQEQRIAETRHELSEFKQSVESKGQNFLNNGLALTVAIGSAVLAVILHFVK